MKRTRLKTKQLEKTLFLCRRIKKKKNKDKMYENEKEKKKQKVVEILNSKQRVGNATLKTLTKSSTQE